MNCDAIDGDNVFAGAHVTDVMMGHEAVDGDTISASAQVIGGGLEAVEGDNNTVDES